MIDDNLEDPVDSFIATCIEARRTGRRAEVDSLFDQHPEFEPEIARFLEDYEQIDQKLAPLRELLGSDSRNAADTPTVGSGETHVASVPQAGGSFGDYELLAEISRGGMGVVFKAQQISLGRVVALKMLLDGGRSTTDRERFLVEARAVARLSHPHIVPIYDVGEHAGRPFFTMEFVAGGSLRERIDELRGDQRAIARLMVTVARAVEHAHRRGILHRDLKPGNVLLDERREPHVTDFGLAKRLDEQSALTQDGAIVGTPSYMAPEQAQATSDLSTAVDVYGLGAVLYELLTGRPPFKGETVVDTMMKARSQTPPAPRQIVGDIDPDLEAICLKCMEREPQARYASAAALADDLERWLDDRPIHARKVSKVERLVKWGRRQPLLAGAAATIAVAALALLILGGFYWRDAEQRAAAVESLQTARLQLTAIESQASAQQQKAEAAKKAADNADDQLKVAQRSANHTLYAADMLMAHAAWEGENFATVADLLGRYQGAAGQEDLRGFEWHYLSRQLHGARLSWLDVPEDKKSQGSVLGMAISPDGKMLATVQKGGKLKLWNLADGRLLQEIDDKLADAGDKSPSNVAGLFFADEGRKLVAVARRPPGHEQNEFSLSAAASAALLGSPGLLAASSPSGMALAESAMNAGSTAMSPARREALSRALSAFFKQEPVSSDKRKLESIAAELEFQAFPLADQTAPRVEAFDANQLQTTVLPLLSTPFAVMHEGQALIVLAIERSPDGKYLAVAGANSKGTPEDQDWSGAIAGGRVIVWNLMKGEIHAEQSSSAAVTALAFSPDSAKLAIGNSNGEISLVKPDLVQPAKVQSENHGWIYCLRFTRDGSRFASGARDGLVLLWDVASDAQVHEVARFRGHTSAVCRVELSPDGQTMVSGGMDGTIKVWDVAHANQSLKLGGHGTTVVGLAFSGANDQLISVDLSGVAQTWRSAVGEPLSGSKAPEIDDHMSRVSRSGKTIAWRDNSATDAMLVRDIATGRQTRINWPDHLPAGLTLSPDDHLLAAANLDERGGLAIWNIPTGRQLATLEGVQASALARPLWAVFSPDSKLLACAQEGGVLLWDWQAKKSRRILDAPGLTTTLVAFSADGRLIAAAADDASGAGVGTVRVWDLRADRVICECHGAGQEIDALAFSPDGRRLATGGKTASEQGTLKLWDTTGGREVFSAQVPTARITAIAFGGDGRRLAAAVTPIDWSKLLKGRGAPSQIYLWDASPLAAATSQ